MLVVTRGRRCCQSTTTGRRCGPCAVPSSTTYCVAVGLQPVPGRCLLLRLLNRYEPLSPSPDVDEMFANYDAVLRDIADRFAPEHDVRFRPRPLSPYVPRTRTALCDRSFAVAGPPIWNSLPASIRDPTLSAGTFAALLKTYLFV